MPKDADFLKMPVVELTSPREGSIVYLNRWWVITENDEVLFYTARGSFSPQCNGNKTVAERVLKLYPNAHIEQIPVAYVPPQARY